MHAEDALSTPLAQIQQAARQLRESTTEQKNAVLMTAATLLEVAREDILEANRRDLQALAENNSDKVKSSAFQDRLLLTPERITALARSLQAVAALEDPVHELVESRTLPNGLLLKRVRSPLGVIFLIFESRPNVAVEAFSIAFKAGNALIMKGGRESSHSLAILCDILHKSLKSAGFPQETLWALDPTDRSQVPQLLKRSGEIDLVVPRGGSGLIQFVEEHSRIPILKNDRGLCHIYVHEDADLEMAVNIIENAKTQRPGVCNAMETLLVHESVKQEFLPRLHDRLRTYPVEWYVCRETLKVLKGKPFLHVAGSSSWDQEYLDLKMNCRIVSSLQQALEHIEQHGSRHSEAILTRSETTARHFLRSVDAAAVYWNASTRFTDGYAMGLGGELGISTQKLHARGPVGLRELTSLRWIIEGQGQVRT